MAMVAEKQKTYKDFAREQVTGSIGQICDAWPDAQMAADAVGFPTGNGGDRSGKGGHGDPTMHKAMNPEAAIAWMRRARSILVLVLKMSATPGKASRWLGPFDPLAMRVTLKEAGAELVDLWPVGAQRVFNRLYDLADEALREWPPTPAEGSRVDGIVVGKPGIAVDICPECLKPVYGGGADPKVRAPDGNSYHRTPCYNSLWQRQERAKRRMSQ